MAHPDWALKFKAKGTELRNINGRFYLYRISSKWDKERKVTRKITHEMIGRITEKDGLIPKGTKKTTEKQIFVREKLANVSVKEYGAAAVLNNMSDDIKLALQNVFPQNWKEIFVLASLRLLHQSPLKNIAFFYTESYLSNLFENLNLSKNHLTELMCEIGANREKISEFLHQFIVGTEHIVFDTTHIISNSRNMSINHLGYNSQGDFDPQVNLFYMFATDKKSPIYYRIFPGNISGIKGLKLTMKDANLSSATVIGDKGFYSEENMNILDEACLDYILPLKRNSPLINYDRLKSGDYDKSFDGHFFYKNRVIFYNELPENDGHRLVIFCDKSLKLEEETCYLKRIEGKYEGYDMSGYRARQHKFGTISMITNIKNMSASKIYESFKSRMEVETVFDTYKNLLQADRTYMQRDESFEAWTFINHIATMMYYKLYNLLRGGNLLAAYSVKDLLMKLISVKKIKIHGEWITSEINTKSAKLFHDLNLNVT